MTSETLPLFYSQPKVLHPGVHAGRSLARTDHYGFAARANAVPLLAAEVPAVARRLPVVFAGGEVPLPVAVLGLADGQNLCVDEQGRWQTGSYVPAYLRRYPFIFLEDEGRKQLTLCVDEAALAPAGEGAHPLFDTNGEPSTLTRSALAFCRDYQAHHLLTVAFGEALAAAELLVERRADISLQDGQKLSLTGFKVIDEARFNQLTGEQLVEWRAKGWLALVYSHLQSIENWAPLLDLGSRSSA